MAAEPHDEIVAHTVRTRRLVIEDEAGRETAYVTVQRRRGGGVDVPYFRIGTVPDEAFFEIGTEADGAPAMRFNDRHGRTRILIEITGDDLAGLTVFDADENARARLVVAADGQPTMMVDRGTRIIRQRLSKEPKSP